MVQRKQVPKKIKEPLTVKNGFPDHDHGGSNPRNRGGGVAMSPGSLPNYMKTTSSSDAKAVASLPKRKPERTTAGRALLPKISYVCRATCSSTMKESKFPAALHLAPGATDAEGPTAARVCRYTYCSLNGHVHAPVIPLRSFLGWRRRLIKTQQSMKLKGVSPFRNNNSGVEKTSPLVPQVEDDFVVEIYATGAPTEGSDTSCSDLSAEEMEVMVRRMEYIVFDHRRCGTEEKVKDLGVLDVSVDGSCDHSHVISDSLVELLRMNSRGYDGCDDDDGCKEKIDGEQEAKDESILVAACETENAGEQEAVVFRVEVLNEQEPRIEENILCTGCEEEACADQQGEEVQPLGTVCRLEIPEQQGAEGAEDDNVPDILIKDESSADQVGEDEDNIMDADCKSGISQELDVKDEENISEDKVSGFVCFNAMGYPDIHIPKQPVKDNVFEQDEDTQKESSIDDVCYVFSGMNMKGDVCIDPTEAAVCPRNKLIIARRTPYEVEYIRAFNPRAPNFLPVEPDPESEKVDLRHQMMDERKNAEEWMLDYALRRAVKNLGRAQKKKVELLVQAFETVLPPPLANEKSMLNEDDKKSVTHTRPMQACS